MSGVPHRGKVSCPSCGKIVRVKPLLENPEIYRARCSCGWTSKNVFNTGG